MLTIYIVPGVEDVSREIQHSKKKGLSLSWLVHGPHPGNTWIIYHSA